MVADFQHLLGIDLESVFWSKSWRWFEIRVCAMLAYPDSLLGASIDADRKKTEPDRAPEATDADMMGAA